MPQAITTNEDAIRELAQPVTFIECLLTFQGRPFFLYRWQRRIAQEINLLTDRWCLQKARQIGGTLLVAAMLVRSAYLTSNATFIVVSRTQEQAGFLYQYAREFFEASDHLREAIDRKRTRKHDLRLKNGTAILARTVGNDAATNLRGISCKGKGALILDESAYVRSEATETLLHVAHGAGICHCSTPRRPHGAFYEATQSKSYKTYKVTAYDSPRITRETIDELRRTLRPSQFRTDVLAEFGAGENCVFDASAIERAIDDNIPLFQADNLDVGALPRSENTNYIYSLDVARSSALDRWAFMIGDYDRTDNALRVVAYASWSGTQSKHENVIKTDDPRRIIADILQFRERFPCAKCYVDVTANEFFADYLQNEYLVPVEKVHWSQARKQLLLEHLATCFRADKVQIPNDPILIGQLLDMSYDVKRMEDESERKIYLAGDDDYVDALAQLSQVITTEPKYTKVDFCEAW